MANRSRAQAKPELEITLKLLRRPSGHRAHRTRLAPGSRTYKGRTSIPQVMNGLGVAIVSTSRGVMTDLESSRQWRGRRSPVLRGLRRVECHVSLNTR